MHILFCGNGWLSIVDLIRERLPEGDTIAVRDFERPLEEQVAGADVLLPSNGRVSAQVMDAATRLALVQQPAAGYDGVELEAARARGIPVCNAPGNNAEAVAETALLLMLSLVRRIPEARRAFAGRKVGEPIGRELFGKTLGIVGMGRSGSHLAGIAGALGMEVLGVRSSSSDRERAAMLERADVI
ncbi:MAG: NAD(P)-dependent oxidoreductase, partial [Polyangiales bacterium]